jgi:hypothetical protein
MHVLLLDGAILAGMVIAYTRDSQSGLTQPGPRPLQSLLRTAGNLPLRPALSVVSSPFLSEPLAKTVRGPRAGAARAQTKPAAHCGLR